MRAYLVVVSGFKTEFWNLEKIAPHATSVWVHFLSAVGRFLYTYLMCWFEHKAVSGLKF